MEEDRWLAAWREDRIGFHEGHPNEMLTTHVERLAGHARVLVPLCGKTHDMAMLATRGHAVVGIELAELAAQAFFREHQLAPEISPVGPFTRYASAPIEILVGDFFATTPALLGPIDAIYDRAALVALPPDVRERYVRLVRTLVAPGSIGLVVTLEYDQSLVDGPPFSVTDAEVRRHFAGLAIDRLVEAPLQSTGKLKTLGILGIERLYAIAF